VSALVQIEAIDAPFWSSYGQMFVRALAKDKGGALAALEEYLLDRGWPDDHQFTTAFVTFPLYERGYTRARHFSIFVLGARAHADSSHALAAHFEHESAANRRLARMAPNRQTQGQQNAHFFTAASGPGILAADGRGNRFVDGDVDRSGLRAVHSCERQQVAAIIDHSDVHGYADASGLGLGRVQDGLRAFECEFRMIECYVSHFRSPLLLFVRNLSTV